MKNKEIVTIENLVLGSKVRLTEDCGQFGEVIKTGKNNDKVDYLVLDKQHSSNHKDIILISAYNSRGKKITVSSPHIAIGYEGKFDVEYYVPFDMDDILGNLDKLEDKLALKAALE